MIPTELLPTLHAMSRGDKLQLIQLLAADVASQDGIAIGNTDGAYPVWSPHEAFDGAATLLRVLEQEKAAS